MCFSPLGLGFSFVVLKFPGTFSLYKRHAFCLAEDCPVFEPLQSPLVSLGDSFLSLNVCLELTGGREVYML